MENNKLPLLEPKYLTENNLWDGQWLQKNNNSFKFNLLNNNLKENKKWQKLEQKKH